MADSLKKEIVESLHNPLPSDVILCSDGHVSYKGYANDNHLKHVVLRADLKQHVKKGGFHIQHINSMHNRLKIWIRSVFWGVSTQFLQNYLNWFKVKETILKKAQNQAESLFKLSMENIKGNSKKSLVHNAIAGFRNSYPVYLLKIIHRPYLFENRYGNFGNIQLTENSYKNYKDKYNFSYLCYRD